MYACIYMYVCIYTYIYIYIYIHDARVASPLCGAPAGPAQPPALPRRGSSPSAHQASEASESGVESRPARACTKGRVLCTRRVEPDRRTEYVICAERNE